LSKVEDIGDFKLSKDVTIEKYIAFLSAKNRQEIAKFIYERFFERYIQPLESIPKEYKNGFCIMANCCLMIEALESFYNGWENTKGTGKGKEAFKRFFNRVTYFSNLKTFYSQFYANVRCGILHQAETTGGWRILRKGPLFDSVDLTINANEFFDGLKKYLRDYKNEVNQSEWNNDVWKNLRKKMNLIISNCKKN
jgi:hypothetical protein